MPIKHSGFFLRPFFDLVVIGLILILSCVHSFGRELPVVVFHDRFVHPDYGFSVLIPAQLEAHPYPAEYPFHGCSIEARDKSWVIVVEAHYYDPDIVDPLASELLDQEASLKSFGGSITGVPIDTSLENLKGIAFGFTVRDSGSKKSLTGDKIIAVRPDSNIIYSISLTAERSDILQGKAVYRAIANSFKVMEIR